MNSKAREALDKIGNISAFVAENCGNAETAKYMNDIISIVQAALAEPLRNCDVGTAEEQEDRFADFCRKHECTMNCPIKKKWSGHNPSCGILWSQMPYEKEGEQ